MKIVSAVTIFGLIFSSLQPQVRVTAGEFFKSF